MLKNANFDEDAISKQVQGHGRFYVATVWNMPCRQLGLPETSAGIRFASTTKNNEKNANS